MSSALFISPDLLILSPSLRFHPSPRRMALELERAKSRPFEFLSVSFQTCSTTGNKCLCPEFHTYRHEGVCSLDTRSHIPHPPTNPTHACANERKGAATPFSV